jgi:hypothetical protein
MAKARVTGPSSSKSPLSTLGKASMVLTWQAMLMGMYPCDVGDAKSRSSALH